MVRGRLASTGIGEVVIDVGGVGYRVLTVPGDVRGSVGAEVTLHTHLSVREDALTLYGFSQPGAVSLFRQLLAVTGVGPKLALAAVGALGPEGLRRAVVSEDVAALTAIPGVGKKGAQRMILELRERLGALGVSDLPGAPAPADDPRSEVRAALAALGYGATEIEQALAGLPDTGAGSEEQLRTALRGLGRR
jgi:Holliday junction DNA helicase RuvA